MQVIQIRWQSDNVMETGEVLDPKKHKSKDPYVRYEWVSLFNANSAIIQVYHDENKLFFNEMVMRCALY
jgi:hypothetical protein